MHTGLATATLPIARISCGMATHVFGSECSDTPHRPHGLYEFWGIFAQCCAR